MQVLGFGGKFQGSIAIAKESEVFGIPNPFALNGLEVSNNLFRAVGRAIVEHDYPCRALGLLGNRFESLAKELLPIIDWNYRDDLIRHYSRTYSINGRPDKRI